MKGLFMKNASLKIINPILGILLINQVLVGLLHGMLPKAVFEVMHEGGGIVLAIVALLHVVLNWKWIKTTYFRKPPAARA